MANSKREPVLQSAVLWFPGYEPDSEFYAPALAAGGFNSPDGFDGSSVVDAPRCWPAAIELPRKDDRGGVLPGWRYLGRRLGIDSRRCVVVEIAPGQRCVVNIDAIGAVLELGRSAGM